MPRHWETTRLFFLSAPRSAFAASRWCSLPAGCFPCRRLLRFPLPTVFHGAPASLTAQRPCRQPAHRRPGCCSTLAPLPATNLIWRRSTPVWLAIWRTWAGFANSQLRRAALRCIYLYICANPHCFHLETAAQTDANLSAHLHRLPTPPPYLRRMRLSPGRGRRYPMDEAVAWPGLRCWVLDIAGA